jgi:hypothetical protein
MKDKEKIDVTNESLLEKVFNHVEEEADHFQSSYVDSSEEQEEIAKYQKIINDARLENQPKKVLKWKPKGVIAMLLVVFTAQFLFLYGSIGYLLWLFHYSDLTVPHLINTFVLTVMLIIFKQWWHVKTEDR